MAINPHRKGGPDVPVVDGGTGASDGNAALTNLGGLSSATHATTDHTGIPGVGSGVLSLVEKREITANTTTTTFTGLNGNVDGIYLLKAFLISDPAEGGVTNYYMNPNGLATNQVCEQKNLSTSYSHAILGRTIIGSNASTTNMSLSSVVIWARASGPGGTPLRRLFNADSQRGGSQLLWTSEWTDTSTILTSLEIEATVANGIRIGSTLALYKLGGV
jgi:hypothetical protein